MLPNSSSKALWLFLEGVALSESFLNMYFSKYRDIRLSFSDPPFLNIVSGFERGTGLTKVVVAYARCVSFRDLLQTPSRNLRPHSRRDLRTTTIEGVKRAGPEEGHLRCVVFASVGFSVRQGTTTSFSAIPRCVCPRSALTSHRHGLPR